MLCPFCSKSEPIDIGISSIGLRICPNCLASFLPASRFSALRTDLNVPTRAAWLRRLKKCAAEFAQPGEVLCLQHNTPLVQGTIPGYSLKGLVPTCCDLQHLPPSLMIDILEMGLGVSSTGMRGFVSASKPRHANPVAKVLGKIAFFLFEKKKKVDDGLDRLQYDSKFKNVLGEWIPE